MMDSTYKCAVMPAAFVTAAVMAYSSAGSIGTINTKADFGNYAQSVVSYERPPYQPYQIISAEQAYLLSKAHVIYDFAEKMFHNMVDLDPEYSKLVDENFWDLI